MHTHERVYEVLISGFFVCLFVFLYGSNNFVAGSFRKSMIRFSLSVISVISVGTQLVQTNFYEMPCKSSR